MNFLAVEKTKCVQTQVLASSFSPGSHDSSSKSPLCLFYVSQIRSFHSGFTAFIRPLRRVFELLQSTFCVLIHQSNIMDGGMSLGSFISSCLITAQEQRRTPLNDPSETRWIGGWFTQIKDINYTGRIIVPTTNNNYDIKGLNLIIRQFNRGVSLRPQSLNAFLLPSLATVLW